MNEHSMDLYYKKQKDLFDRWQNKYTAKTNAGGKFTFDGVVFDQTEEKRKESWGKWENATPKILFLLKEAFGDYEPECPAIIGRNFGINMALWKFALLELSNNPESRPSLDKCSLNGMFDGVAFMEVKKIDEGNSQSNDREILQYAVEDRELLQEQIELINPDIIVCCGTFIAYQKGIYNSTDEIVHLAYRKVNNLDASIFSHNNRKVFYLYHPSYAMNREDAFNLLCELWTEGNKKVANLK